VLFMRVPRWDSVGFFVPLALTSVMGSAGFGWSGLRGRFVGDVAAAVACTLGPKPGEAAIVQVSQLSYFSVTFDS